MKHKLSEMWVWCSEQLSNFICLPMNSLWITNSSDLPNVLFEKLLVMQIDFK